MSSKVIAKASPRLWARLAGFLYLLIIVGAIFIPFAIARSGMMRGEEAVPTIARMLASKQMYVLGRIAQLLLGACDVGIAVIFYELFKPVSRSLALLSTA